MSTDLTPRPAPPLDSAIERVLIEGDLRSLNPAQRVTYYNAVCRSLGINPLTQPFAYITLNNKLTLYAKKDCTDQLRNLRVISIAIVAREVIEGVYVVTAKATMPGPRPELDRVDESTGAVAIESLKGELRANAMMKAETKAKRRVTLSIAGLGLLDESEVEGIPDADPVATKPELEMTAINMDPPKPASPPISPAQAKRLWAIATASGWSELEVKALYARHGFTRSAEITKDMYDRIVSELEGGTDALSKAREQQ